MNRLRQRSQVRLNSADFGAQGRVHPGELRVSGPSHSIQLGGDGRAHACEPLIHSLSNGSVLRDQVFNISSMLF